MEYIKKAYLGFACLIIFLSAGYAQDINWFTNLNLNAYPSPYFNDWERGDPSIGSLYLQYQGSDPVDYYFQTSVNSVRRGNIFSGTSEVLSTPGAFVRTLFSSDYIEFDDVDYNSEVETQIIRTGRLPEGEYELVVQIYSNGNLLAEDSAPFYIIYPDPPQLILPPNSEAVVERYPTFQWTPVIVPVDYQIDYNLLIVERLPGQSLQRAIDANYPHHEAVISNIPYYTYPIDGLELERGKEYVWQIRATDQYGAAPTSNDGKSEIWSFFYGESGGDIVENFPYDTLYIARAFAYITNFDRLTITENDFSYILNGSASLTINFTDDFHSSVEISITNLVMDKSFNRMPVFNSGNFSASVRRDDFPDEWLGEYFAPENLEYTPAAGLTVDGRLNLPGELGQHLLAGSLNLSAGGLSGRLTATGDPLFDFGNDALTVAITQATLTFSEPELALSGGINIFGHESFCSIDQISLGDGGRVTGAITCESEFNIPLVEGSDRFALNVHGLSGNFSVNLDGSELEFNVAAAAGLDFHPDNAASFGADIALEINQSGLSVESFTPRGDLDYSSIDLGWLNLKLSDLSLSSLTYLAGNWDFELGMNLEFAFPDLDSLNLPAISGVTFSPSGFTIPETNVPSLHLPRVDFVGFELEMLALRFPAMTFPWFNWDINTLADFGFEFDLRLRFPNFPEGTPIELRDPEIIIDNASFINGNFNAPIPTVNFAEPGLQIPLAEAIGFNVTEIAGALGATYDGGSISLSPDVRLQGSLQLPEEFTCEGHENLELLSTSIQVLGDGKLNGTIENLIPPCPLNLGMLSLVVSSSTLNFYLENNYQRIRLDGAAGLDLQSPGGQPLNASVNFSYEFIQNELLSLEGDINTPFVWNIPSPENPALSFNISRAELSTDGIVIDGRQRLKFIDNTELGVTFDHLAVNWRDFNITSGNVTFDTPFAFKVALSGDSLIYQAVPIGTELTEPLGIMLELPEAISIGADGFSAHGQAGIHLKYEDYDLPSLLGNYSPDFALSLSPFKVSSGQLEFMAGESRIALIDSRGFFPDLSYFGMAFLPERLPLPSEDIAYIQLKSGDSLLVNHELSDDGLRLYTRPGQPVNLVMACLQLNQPSPPQIGIEFDITIDPLDRGLVDGSLNVTIPPESYPTFDLSSLGIPFEIRDIVYGDIDGVTGFRFGGFMKLFETSIGDQAVELTIMPDGRLLGDFNFPTSQNIPLVEGSENLSLTISNITGSFATQFVPFNLDFDLSLTGGIRLNLADTLSYGASTTLNVTQHGVSLQGFEADIPNGLPRLNLGSMNLLFSNFTIPRLDYSQLTGWDFEIGVDLGLGFPDFGFNLPQMNGITISKNGIHIPEYSIPELAEQVYSFEGFGIKPLAFRMAGLTFDWFHYDGSPLADWGFAFDFQLSFPEFPDFVPPELRNPEVTILNAGYWNGKITGTLETKQFDLPGMLLPLGGGLNYYVREIGGELASIDNAQNISITFRGDIQMPEAFWCEGDSGRSNVMSTAFTINSGGQLSGQLVNFIPNCPFDIGIGKLAINNSNINMYVDAGQQNAVMALSGTLMIPGTTPGDSIQASGDLTFDLIHARIIDGQIGINTPFSWNVPSDDPVLTFTINQAVLNSSGLLIDGSNQLNLTEGANVGVDFNNLLIDITNFNVVSGSATFSSQFALKFATELGGLDWSAVDISAPIEEATGVRLNLPENISLGVGGLAMSGQTNIFIKFDGEDYPNVSAQFSESFNIAFSPFGVSRGRADFYIDNDMVAFVDSNGFHPGNFFGLLPIPAKLPVPDTNVAYIVLKDGDNVLVESQTVANGLQISTRNNQPVQLVIPALQYESPEPPSFGINFSVVVNIATFELVDGSISITPPQGEQSLLSLANAGIPLDLTQLLYSKIQNTPTFMASAKIALPEALGGVNVSLDSLVISPNGFSGQVTLGQFSQFYQADANYIVNVPIGDMFNFKVGGVQANFSQNDFDFRFCGDLTTQLFSNEGDTAAIHYVAAYESGNFGFGFDISHLPDASLPLYIASFRPEVIGDSPAFDLSFPDGSFALTLSGTLSLEDFGEGFEVSFAGLKISPDGVTVPDVNITTPEDFLRFELFTAQFEIKDVEGHPGLTFNYDENVFNLSLSGEITFLNNTSSFYGFQIGTNGSVSIAGVNLLSNDVYIVDDYLALTQLGIRENAFFVEGFAKLPEPCDTARQSFNFSISPDGTVDGGANIVMINEQPGLGGDDSTELPLWVATFDPTYAAINFDFGDIGQSSVQLCADIYFMNDADRWVHIGTRSGGVVNPGFEVKFDGTVRWGNLQSSPQLFRCDWDALRLDSLRFASFETEQADFGLSISGKLNVNVSGVGGGLQFEDLRVTSSGDVQNLAGSIVGGDITITDMVTVTISDIGFSSSPTDIEVTGGASCSNMGGGAPEQQSNTVHVQSYFRFGASIDIADVGGGGIRQFLAYTTENSTHIIIDSAYVNIPDVVVFTLDFTYEQVQGDGFALLIGGQGLFVNSYGIAVVGKISTLGGETSFGLFVAVDVTITIPPCLVITGLGGGFFYNPTECDLALVREMAGFGNDNPAGERMNADPGRFAILLYGQLAVVNDYLVYGRVLLTITEGYFRLDGRVVLLDQDAYLRGSVYLMIGFSNGFAEGNIEVEITVGDFLTGKSGFSFFVYGADAWGIRGFADMKVMMILNAEANLFIGNPGFLVNMRMTYGYNIWILEINAGFEAMAWYQANVSWGLYGKVWVEASAFWGAVTAKGWLEAALIKKQDWYIFGLAGIRGCVLGICKSASVWVKIHDGDISGGTGRNSEMDDMIDEAKNIGSDMEEEAAAAQDAISDAVIEQFLLSDQQLLDGFSNLYKYSQLLRQDNLIAQIFGALFLYYVGDIQEMEFTRGQAPPSPTNQYCSDRGYFNQQMCQTYWTLHRLANVQEATYLPIIYNNYFLNQSAPDMSARDSLFDIRDRLDNLIHDFDQDRNQLSNRLNQVAADMSSIPELEFAFANPVSSANFDFEAETYQQGDSTFKRAVNMPGFSLDEALATGNEDNMENAEDAFGQYEQAIVDRIGLLESAIESVSDALTDDASINVDDFGRSYADLIFEIGKFFVSDQRFNKNEKNYAQTMASQLGAYQNTLQSIFTQKAQGMLNNELRDLAWERKKAVIKFGLDFDLSDDSTQFFTLWQSMSGQQNEMAAKRQVCADAGMELWFHMCHRGFQHLDSMTTEMMQTQIPAQYEDELANIALSQTAYTASLDPLFDARVALTEKLYDILSLYGEWQEREADTVQWLIPSNQVQLKKSELMQQLQVPVVNTANVGTMNNDYWNYGTLNWSASHPSGIIDYAINIQRQGQPQEGVGLQSVGRRMSMVRYFLQHDNITNENWTLKLRARGGAGYTNERQTSFTTYYTPAGGGGLGDYDQYYMGGDNTPPSQPTVSFPDYPVRMVSMYIPQMGYYIDVPYYYSSTPNEIHAQWTAADNQSGIVEYQYSVGTSQLGTQLVNWTSVGGMDDQTIYGLNLQNGQIYYVNAKARNGSNLWGIGGYSPRLKVDISPPTTPTVRFVFQFGGFPGGPLSPIYPPPVMPPVPLPDELIPPIAPPGQVYQIYFPGEAPKLSALWNAADDPESGVHGYQYRLISATDTMQRLDDWIYIGDSLQLTTEHEMLSYADSFYIDIEAVNYAGINGSLLRVGPYTPRDPSVPSRPVAALSYGLPAGTNYLIFTTRSVDYETGIDHYEIAAGTLPGGTDLVDWGHPFSPDEIGTANSWVLPDLGLAQGSTCYIHLRAVNGQGMYSSIIATGPYLIDYTPPVTPRVSPSVVVNGRMRMLDLVYSHIEDPESGVENIEYAVGSVNGATNIVSWTSVELNTETWINYISLGWGRPQTYYIGVRTTNGVNMKSQEFWTSVYVY